MTNTLLLTSLSVVAMVLTIIMYSVPFRAAREILLARTPLAYSAFPFAAITVNCLLWTAYGVVSDTLWIVVCNVIGTLSGCYSLAAYGMYGHGPAYYRAVCFAFLGLVASFLLLYKERNEEHFLSHLRIIANAATCVMYAAPLTAIQGVLATSSAEHIPITQVFTNTLCAAAWMLNGLASADGYLLVPHGLGLLLGLGQMLLYVRCKSPEYGCHNPCPMKCSAFKVPFPQREQMLLKWTRSLYFLTPKTSLDDLRHFQRVVEVITAAPQHISQIASALAPETHDYFSRHLRMNVLDVIKQMSKAVKVESCSPALEPPCGWEGEGKHVTVQWQRVNGGTTLLEIALNYHLSASLRWCKLTSVETELRNVLEVDVSWKSVEQYVKSQCGQAWIVLSWDGASICLLSWYNKTGRVPPMPCLPRVPDFNTLANDLGAVLESGEEWVPVAKIAPALSEDALMELKKARFRSLREFLVAHPEMYKLSENGQFVRSLRLEQYDLAGLQRTTLATLSPLFCYTPAYWVPLSAVLKECKKANDEAALQRYKELGEINSLIVPTSGVVVRWFAGLQRNSSIKIVRRMCREFPFEGAPPCVAKHDSYRITRGFVRSLEAMLPDTSFKPFAELEREIDLTQMQWPLDILCSFFPFTFDLSEVGSVRSRRLQAETKEFFLQPQGNFELVFGFLSETATEAQKRIRERKREVQQKRRLSFLQVDESKFLTAEQLRDKLLEFLPEDDILVCVSDLDDELAGLSTDVARFGGWQKLLKKFPCDFHLVPTPGREHTLSVKRGFGQEPPQEANIFLNDEEALLTEIHRLLKRWEFTNGPRPLKARNVGNQLPVLARDAFQKVYGGISYLQNRPDHFVVKVVGNDYCVWSVKK